MHVHTDDGEDLTLNLAPMIDVVFLLLIFFMVATTFIDREKEMGIDLPQAQSGEEPLRDPERVTINVGEDGTITVNGEVLDEAGLRGFLERVARHDPETPVDIRGDESMQHRHLVAVMDACRITGLSDIGIGIRDGAR